MSTITLTIIKPDAMTQGYASTILSEISHAGFHIQALKKLHLTKAQAEAFYSVHKEKPFYKGLVDFMCSGPVIAAILVNKNAVEAYRKFIGNTNPEQAAEGSLRKKYGTSVRMNAVHGSDSDANAAVEASFFFSALERF